jgi:hypothetical protein
MKSGKDNLQLRPTPINLPDDRRAPNFDILSERVVGKMNDSFRKHKAKAIASKQMPKCFHIKKDSMGKPIDRNTSVVVVPV